MGIEEEEIEEEYDEKEPFGLNKPAAPARRGSLGGLAKKNAVVRRKGEYGELDEDRVDEANSGLRPGTFYRPF